MSSLIITSLTLVSKLPGTVSFFLIPLLVLGYATCAVVIIISSLVLLSKSRPRRAASIFLVLLLPVLLWRPIGFMTDLIHLGLTAGLGAGTLGTTSIGNADQLHVDDWSVGLAGGPNTFLIQDLTDEIALPSAKHTHPSSVDNGFENHCAGKVDHLLGHYYVCTI